MQPDETPWNAQPEGPPDCPECGRPSSQCEYVTCSICAKTYCGAEIDDIIDADPAAGVCMGEHCCCPKCFPKFIEQQWAVIKRQIDLERLVRKEIAGAIAKAEQRPSMARRNGESIEWCYLRCILDSEEDKGHIAARLGVAMRLLNGRAPGDD